MTVEIPPDPRPGFDLLLSNVIEQRMEWRHHVFLTNIRRIMCRFKANDIFLERSGGEKDTFFDTDAHAKRFRILDEAILATGRELYPGFTREEIADEIIAWTEQDIESMSDEQAQKAEQFLRILHGRISPEKAE